MYYGVEICTSSLIQDPSQNDVLNVERESKMKNTLKKKAISNRKLKKEPNLQKTNSICLMYLWQDKGIFYRYGLQEKKIKIKTQWGETSWHIQDKPTIFLSYIYIKKKGTSLKTTCSFKNLRWCWGQGSSGSSAYCKNKLLRNLKQ